MRTTRFVFVAAGLALTLAGAAQADTVATFADPSPAGTTPVFRFNGSQLTGGWSGPGLTLNTVGLPSVPDFANATFTMTPLNAANIFGNFWALSGGSINFFDSSSNPLLTISFSAATLNVPAGFGASDFVGQNVTFSGPILAGYTSVSNEAFSFSFANPVGTATNLSVTSAFTSSADLLVPAPVSAGLLGLGALAATRRKRK